MGYLIVRIGLFSISNYHIRLSYKTLAEIVRTPKTGDSSLFEGDYWSENLLPISHHGNTYELEGGLDAGDRDTR